MSQDLKNRIEHLIEKGEDILSLATIKYVEIWGEREVLGGDGSDLFHQWKISCKKALKQISEIDYESFISSEKASAIDTQPRILKRLLAVLRASLDDLNSNILDKNTTNVEKDNVTGSTTIHYHSLNNYGNLSSHNDGSTINQTSTNTVQVIKGDFNSLASKLKDYGVEETDIQNLKNVIDVTPTPTSSDELGEGVTNWLGKMSLKALKGSLKVGKDVAMGVLVDAITTYYCG